MNQQPDAKPGILILLFLFVWHAMPLSAEPVDAQMVTFHINNKCDFPIWPAVAPNSGQPVIADGGFILHSDRSRIIEAPPNWNGRFWARTGCNFSCHSCHPKPTCQTGDCSGKLACNGSIGLPPATLIEVSLQPNTSLPSFYDVSIVDGFNLPVAMSTKPSKSNCSIKGCTKNINRVCPKELRVLDNSGEVVACKSACLAFDEDAYCCRKKFGTPESCKPNLYSKEFKEACPSYISYAFDTPIPLVACYSKEFVITFCPSKWDAHQSM